jgi:hypothetical protein
MSICRLGSEDFDMLPGPVTDYRFIGVSVQAKDRSFPLLDQGFLPDPVLDPAGDLLLIGLRPALEAFEQLFVGVPQAPDAEVDWIYSSSRGTGATWSGRRFRVANRMISACSGV